LLGCSVENERRSTTNRRRPDIGKDRRSRSRPVETFDFERRKRRVCQRQMYAHVRLSKGSHHKWKCPRNLIYIFVIVYISYVVVLQAVVDELYKLNTNSIENNTKNMTHDKKKLVKKIDEVIDLLKENEGTSGTFLYNILFLNRIND